MFKASYPKYKTQVPKSLKFNLEPTHQVAMILNFLFDITFY